MQPPSASLRHSEQAVSKTDPTEIPAPQTNMPSLAREKQLDWLQMVSFPIPKISDLLRFMM